MDTFITTVMVIYDNINKEKEDGPRLINNKITEKQFLAYYIYRLWIKYRKLMEDVNTPTDVRKILLYMEVPKKYHDIYLTYPMADKMPINEKQLDLIILSMLKHLNQTYKVYGQRSDGSIPPENKYYKLLTKYLTGKTIENIIQDVIQIKLLVPNLSRPANVRNIWDGIDQMLDDIDVIEPVVFENPASEIPDSKLIENGSSSSNIIPTMASAISNSNIMPLKINNVSSTPIINKPLNNNVKPLNNKTIKNTNKIDIQSSIKQPVISTNTVSATSRNSTRNISSNKKKNSSSGRALNVSNSSKSSTNSM